VIHPIIRSPLVSQKGKRFSYYDPPGETPGETPGEGVICGSDGDKFGSGSVKVDRGERGAFGATTHEQQKTDVSA